MEERATREAFSHPQRQSLPDRGKRPYHQDSREREYRKETQISSSSQRVWNNEKETSRDLSNQLQDRRDYHSKNVWNRLDNPSKPEFPRNREMYHPYHHNSHGESKAKTRDTASSSEWRVKETSAKRHEHTKVDSRNRIVQESGRNRASPDSQRTISDNFRRSWQNRRSHTTGVDTLIGPVIRLSIVDLEICDLIPIKVLFQIKENLPKTN